MNAEEVLDAFEVWHVEQLDREIRKFVAAAHFADLHHPDKDAVPADMLPGSEQARRLGGAGTPLVMEFAAAELGARMGKSPYAGRSLMADALDVRHRLPLLWARVCAGEVAVGYARFVAQQTRDLSDGAAGFVDVEVSEYADGRLTWSRFETLVAAKIVDADPEAAAQRERAAAEEQFAKVGRSNEHGQKTLYVKSGAAEMVRINATIDYLAEALKALGDEDTEDRRRAKSVLIMANPIQAVALLQAFAGRRGSASEEPEVDALEAEEPADGPTEPFLGRFHPDQVRTSTPSNFDPSALMPKVTLYIHLSEEAVTRDVGGVARWETEGPISTGYVRDFLGPHCRFTIRPVVDLAGMAPVDAYEIPERLREAVHMRSPADVFPFASNTGRRHQLDHTRPYVPPDHGGPPGQTGVDNLGPLVQFHHRIKTFGAWQVKQPFSGVCVWRDPHGHLYLVDHTGTRKLGNAPTSVATADTTAEVYPGPFPVELAFPEPHRSGMPA